MCEESLFRLVKCRMEETICVGKFPEWTTFWNIPFGIFLLEYILLLEYICWCILYTKNIEKHGNTAKDLALAGTSANSEILNSDTVSVGGNFSLLGAVDSS